MFLRVGVFVLVCLAGTLTGQECPALQEEDWSYQGANGPMFWGNLNENYRQCNGDSQSPIAIDLSKVKKTNLPRLSLINYDVPVTSATIVNNGHTVQVQFTDGIWRGFIDNNVNFTFNQLHFHWGSEHTLGIRNRTYQYALEMHLVHTSNESPSRIGVIGVLYKETWHDLRALNPIVNTLEEVTYKGEEAMLSESLVLSNLVPRHHSLYVRYEGSLTTPGCDEGVMWTVFIDCLYVGRHQMEKFRSLYAVAEDDANSESCKLVDNFRPPQPLNNRVIYAPNVFRYPTCYW